MVHSSHHQLDGLRENRFSLPNLSRYRNVVSPEREFHVPSDTDEITESVMEQGFLSGRQISLNKNLGRSKHDSSFVSHDAPVRNATNRKNVRTPSKKHSGQRKQLKSSKSSQNIARSKSSSKTAKLSKSMTSLKGIDVSSSYCRGGKEQCWEQLDSLRSSMSISRMSIQTPHDGDLTTESDESTYPDLDDTSPEMYQRMLLKNKTGPSVF